MESRVLLSAAAADTAGEAVFRAESARRSGAVASTAHPGFSGSGFVDFVNASGDFLEFTVDVPAEGTYSLNFRYANGSPAIRRMDLAVNAFSTDIDFLPSGGWANW